MEIEKTIFKNNSLALCIDVTHKCNLHCSYCTHYTNNDLYIDFKHTQIYIDNNIKKFKTLLIDLYGGEPMLHPDVLQFIKFNILKYDANFIITTNLNYDSKFIQNLVQYNKNIQFLLSFHFEAKYTLSYFKNLKLINTHFESKMCIPILKKGESSIIKFISYVSKFNNIKVTPTYAVHSIDGTEVRIEKNYILPNVNSYEPGVGYNERILNITTDNISYKFKICIPMYYISIYNDVLDCNNNKLGDCLSYKHKIGILCTHDRCNGCNLNFEKYSPKEYLKKYDTYLIPQGLL